MRGNTPRLRWYRWALPLFAAVALAYRSAPYAYRFVWFIYQSTKPVYRLAQNSTERVSITRFIARFVLTRILIVGGRVTSSKALTEAGRCVANDLGFRLRGIRYFIDMKAGELFSFQEIYHERTYEQVADFVPQTAWTVFDIGANAGVFSVQQACRGAHVYAFEPNPECYRRLSRIVAENHLAKNIDVFNYALGSTPGMGTLVMQDGVTCIGVVVPSSDTSDTPPFQIKRLDDVAPALEVKRIDLLKLDTEGSEVEILHGATQTLTMVDRIILEYHSSDLLEQSRDVLRTHGFEPVLQVDQGAGTDRGILYARHT